LDQDELDGKKTEKENTKKKKKDKSQGSFSKVHGFFSL